MLVAFVFLAMFHMYSNPGRKYIILSAALILVAATLRMYVDKHGDGGLLTTMGQSVAKCDSRSIQLSQARIGCQRNSSIAIGSTFARGSAKAIQVGDR